MTQNFTTCLPLASRPGSDHMHVGNQQQMESEVDVATSMTQESTTSLPLATRPGSDHIHVGNQQQMEIVG